MGAGCGRPVPDDGGNKSVSRRGSGSGGVSHSASSSVVAFDDTFPSIPDMNDTIGDSLEIDLTNEILRADALLVQMWVRGHLARKLKASNKVREIIEQSPEEQSHIPSFFYQTKSSTETPGLLIPSHPKIDTDVSPRAQNTRPSKQGVARPPSFNRKASLSRMLFKDPSFSLRRAPSLDSLVSSEDSGSEDSGATSTSVDSLY